MIPFVSKINIFLRSTTCEHGQECIDMPLINVVGHKKILKYNDQKYLLAKHNTKQC